MKMYRELTSRKYYKYLSNTFVPSATLQSFTIPSTTTKLIVDCVASKGADATGAGGNGGRVQCTLPVTPSSTLYFYVGAIPADSHVAEYNASDIRTDNTGVLDGTSLSSRLVVAGAGGSGGSNASNTGGNGGGLTGANGGGSSTVNGKGGTQSAGGAGTVAASNGAFGIGGNAYTASSGGAGGAGWYGGGGSRATGGAGGGSSYTDASCTYITHTQGFNAGEGYIKITYAVQSTPYDYDYYVDEATYKAKNIELSGVPTFYTPISMEAGRYVNPIKLTGYSIQGTPSIVNGIVSGISSSSYVYVTGGFNPGSNPWESVTKARVHSFTNKSTIISYQFSGTKSFQLSVGNGSNAGKLIFYGSTNGSSTDIANNLTSSSTITADVWYWFKIKFTGSSYEVLVSDDNEAWTNYITLSSTLIIRQGTQNSYGFNFSAYPEVIDGEIDLNGTYIKYNGTYWFRGDLPSGIESVN